MAKIELVRRKDMIRFLREKQDIIDQLEKDKQEAIEMLIKWHSIVFAKPYNSNEIMECDHVQLIEKLTGKSIEELLK